MVDASPREMSIITDILREHVPHSEVRAFGSRCKGTNGKHSDLDIAVVAPGKLAFDELADLRATFEACEIPFRVDVLDYNAISKEFRAVIDREYQVIFPTQKLVG